MNSISGISNNETMLAAAETLKSKWDSFSDDTIGTITVDAGGPRVGCIYYKLRNDFGVALLITYYVPRPAYIIKTRGNWEHPIWL